MITITNNNIYYSEFPISTLSSLDKVEKIHMLEITNFLSDDVEFGETVTLKRLFEIAAANIDKFNEIFYSSLGGYPLEPFLQEIENNPTESVESEYLEIHWYSDKYEDNLSIYPSLQGMSSKEDMAYAVDFISLNNIKDHVVKINRMVEIYDYNKMKESTDENIKKEDIVIKLGNKPFNLFDVFNAIFYEISFHGGPHDKKERLDDLEDSIDESKEQIENGEDKGVTFEELLEKIESSDKYLVKYKELRDRVEEDRIKNDKNLDKLKNCLIEKLKIHDVIQNSDEDLKQYYKKLTDIEYNMQLLYGEVEDIDFHRFWETPKCTCPKIDNLEIYPSNKPIFDDKCPIHGK